MDIYLNKVMDLQATSGYKSTMVRKVKEKENDLVGWYRYHNVWCFIIWPPDTDNLWHEAHLVGWEIKF